VNACCLLNKLLVALLEGGVIWFHKMIKIKKLYWLHVWYNQFRIIHLLHAAVKPLRLAPEIMLNWWHCKCRNNNDAVFQFFVIWFFSKTNSDRTPPRTITSEVMWNIEGWESLQRRRSSAVAKIQYTQDGPKGCTFINTPGKIKRISSKCSQNFWEQRFSCSFYVAVKYSL